MKMTVFHYMKKKYMKQLKKLTTLNFLLIILLLFSVFTIFISTENIRNNILNNERLSMVLINGYTKNGEFTYDTEKIKKMDHVKDLSYEYEIPLSYLGADGEQDFMNCLTLNPTTRDAINYHKSVKGNEIILPDSFKGSKLKFTDLKNKPLSLKQSYYEGSGIFFLKDKCYLAPQTSAKLAEQISKSDNYSSAKSLLVNITKTEYIYDFVQDFNNMFDEEKAYVYYQAEGLEELVTGSKMSMYLLILFQVVLLAIVFVFYRNSLNALIKTLNRDLLSLYINGLSSKEITRQFYSTIESMNKKIYRYSYALIALCAVGMWKYMGTQPLLIMVAGLVVLLSLLIVLNKRFVKLLITRKMKKELSNDNIVSQLRN